MTLESRLVVQKSEVVSDEAIVATMHPHATRAGVEVLKKGGNAVDAAVAAGFAIGVVEPFNSGLGGIAQMVLRDGKSGASAVIDGTSTLPRGIRPEAFELEGEGVAGMYGWPAVKGDANNTGYRAVAVPGTPACLCEAQARYGRLPLAEVMEPAIRLAESGFELDWFVALVLAGEMARVRQFPGTLSAYFRLDGSPYKAPMFTSAGDRLVQSDLARTLRAIADGGADAYYRGEIASRVAEAMAANGGFVDEQDFAAYRVRIWEPGLIGEYRGCQTIQAPENTGAPTTLEALQILDGFDLRALGHNSIESLHLIAEALRLAFLDRFAHLGDPAFAAVPNEAIVSREYAAERRREIDPRRANRDARAGDPWRFERSGRTARAPASASAGDGMTTHISVIDRDRTMVSLTSTLGQFFGSGVVVPGLGFPLNSGVTWFDPVPGRVNSIEAGKRILWAGTPTLVVRDGKPLLAVGAPGARKILSAVLQSIVNVVDFDMGAQDAVAAPRIHCEGRETWVDSRIDDSVVDGLHALGHEIIVKEETLATSYFARPAMVLVDPATDRLRGGVNVFNPAMAMGI